MADKKKVDRSRLWIDQIVVGDQGLYRWEVYQGSILKKSGFSFSADEAQDDIAAARELLGANK